MGNDILKVRAYTVIKQRIVDCTYRPGTMITEEQLKEELGISRTPIRDALGRLEQEHLIAIKPKKGILVSPIDLDEVTKIFEIRLIFEPYALLNYGYRIDETSLRKQYRLFANEEHMEPNASPFEKDDAFHHMIIDTIPNDYIHQCYNITTIQNNRLRILTGISRERLHDTATEHVKILKACLKKEWGEAATAMREHLLQSKNAAFDLLLQAEEEPDIR